MKLLVLALLIVFISAAHLTSKGSVEPEGECEFQLSTKIDNNDGVLTQPGSSFDRSCEDILLNLDSCTLSATCLNGQQQPNQSTFKLTSALAKVCCP